MGLTCSLTVNQTVHLGADRSPITFSHHVHSKLTAFTPADRPPAYRVHGGAATEKPTLALKAGRALPPQTLPAHSSITPTHQPATAHHDTS